jgi:membrane protein DedA with SNARE-associated domain
MEALLAHLGYTGLALGAFLEGEAVVAMSGFLAHAHYLSVFWVFVIAGLSTFLGDQIFFMLGRRHGDWVINKFPGFGRKVEKAKVIITKHQHIIMAGFRFLYGLRIATLFALGASGIRFKKFFFWNIFNAIVWTTIFVFGGYYFGEVFGRYIRSFRKEFIIYGGGTFVVAWGAWMIYALIKDMANNK